MYRSNAEYRSLLPSYSAPSRPPHITKVEAPTSAATSTACSTLRSPNRRTERSFEVSPPSLNTGCENVFVVTISITRPALSQASRSRPSRSLRVASSASNG